MYWQAHAETAAREENRQVNGGSAVTVESFRWPSRVQSSRSVISWTFHSIVGTFPGEDTPQG